MKEFDAYYVIFLSCNENLVICPCSVACVIMRMIWLQYYFAWTLAEGACIACGLGFNGIDKAGKLQWNRVCNANILDVELASSFRSVN